MTERAKTNSHFLRQLAPTPGITLMMDNLNTHGAAGTRPTRRRAKALWDRFEFVYTPKHGSWLNVAEIELNVMIRQFGRIDRPDRRWRPGAGSAATSAD